MNLSKYTREFTYNWKLAYPVILGMLGHTFVSLVDNVMVGKIGPAELAAVSLGNSFTFIAMSLGIGFSTAITPLVAAAHAAAAAGAHAPAPCAAYRRSTCAARRRIPSTGRRSNAHLKLHRDGTTCLEMTLGPRRIELQADVPNETYLQAAAPLASISSTTQAATLTTWRDRIKAMPTETTYPLTPTQQARLDSLPHRFPQVYEEPTYDTHVDHPLGEQQLVVTAGALLPQRRQPRPLSKAKADALLDILNKLETKGYISRSKSSLGAPVLLVPKPDGSCRGGPLRLALALPGRPRRDG